MKKMLLIIIIALYMVGCGGNSGGGNSDINKVSINLQKPAIISSLAFSSVSLSYNDIWNTSKYATYVTCDIGTIFNGGYAANLNQRIGLTANVTDSSGNPFTISDPSNIIWENPDPTNIYFWDNKMTGLGVQLDIRKSGKYTIAASYQGVTGSCQVIVYNSTYIGKASTYTPSQPNWQGVVFNSDILATQTNDITIADLYIDYANSDENNLTLVAPGGVTEPSLETWTQLDFVYLHQFGNVKTVPNLTFNGQITISNRVPHTLILKKRDNSAYVKIAILGSTMGLSTNNYASIAYAISQGISSGAAFPISFD